MGAEEEHAARLLAEGWDAQAVAELTGIPLDQVRALAAQRDTRIAPVDPK